MAGSRIGQTLSLMLLSVGESWHSLSIAYWPCIGEIKRDSRRVIGGCPEESMMMIFELLSYAIHAHSGENGNYSR